MRMRGDAGQAAIEFALAVPVALFIVLSIVQAGQAIYEQSTLAYAAREGARFAVVHGDNSATPAGPAPLSDQPVRDAVVRAASNIGGVTATVTYLDGNNSRGSRVQVDAVATYRGIGFPAIVVRGTSVQVIQQ